MMKGEKVLTIEGDRRRLGAFVFPDRKKPYIAVQDGTAVRTYGQFRDAEAANEFMDILGEMVGAKFEY